MCVYMYSIYQYVSNWFCNLPLTEIEDSPCAILSVIQTKTNVVTNPTFLRPNLASDVSLLQGFNMFCLLVLSILVFKQKNLKYLKRRFTLNSLACR